MRREEGWMWGAKIQGREGSPLEMKRGRTEDASVSPGHSAGIAALGFRLQVGAEFQDLRFGARRCGNISVQSLLVLKLG